jgi:hypothetical protein
MLVVQRLRVHGASLATVLLPVDAKRRRIAGTRTQIRVLDQICA